MVQTDASAVATGAILLQRFDNGATRVIAYSSHKLPPSATISNTGPEKEMLTVIVALKEWRHFLLGRPFDL
jgi:hypothetical protein